MTTSSMLEIASLFEGVEYQYRILIYSAGIVTDDHFNNISCSGSIANLNSSRIPGYIALAARTYGNPVLPSKNEDGNV